MSNRLIPTRSNQIRLQPAAINNIHGQAVGNGNGAGNSGRLERNNRQLSNSSSNAAVNVGGGGGCTQAEMELVMDVHRWWKRAYKASLAWFYCAFCCCLPDSCRPEEPVVECMVRPIRQRVMPRFSEAARIRVIIALVWTVSIVLSTPHAFFSEVTHIKLGEFEMTRCRSNVFSSPTQAKLLSAYTFCSQYLVPIGLTTYFYLHIGIFLWRRQTVGVISERRRIIMEHCKRRRIVILVLVVLAFAICWLPLNLYNLLVDFDYTNKDVCKFLVSRFYFSYFWM